jgi:hypothetical protein
MKHTIALLPSIVLNTQVIAQANGKRAQKYFPHLSIPDYRSDSRISLGSSENV